MSRRVTYVRRTTYSRSVAITYEQVAVTSTATALMASDGDGAELTLKAEGATVYLGDADVETTSGFELAVADGVIKVTVFPDDGILYAITATTATVHVLRTRS